MGGGGERIPGAREARKTLEGSVGRYRSFSFFTSTGVMEK